MEKKRAFLLIFIFILCLFFLPLINADGFAIYTDRSIVALHGENTQIAAINYENGVEKLLLAVKLEQLTNDSIVWIVPIPANASEIKINIFEEFPRFFGNDILLLAKEKEKVVSDMATLVSMSQIYTFPFILTKLFMAGEGGRGVEVYAHVEKEGIVTEVITAENADSLYNYLNNKNIKITKGAIPVIEQYIGEDYSFVVSWVKAKPAEHRTPAIFVEFPTDKIYYPLKPTSIYGERGIPILIYIVGYAKTNFYSEIKDSAEIRYFRGRIYGENLEDFYKGETINYTRLMIGFENEWITVKELEQVKSENFVQDLWMEQLDGPPKEIQEALTKIKRANLLNKSGFMVLWLIIASLISGALSGLIIFKNAKKFSLIGLANCLTLVGLIVMTLLVAKKEKIGKRFLFIILFSIIFLIINFFVISPLIKFLIF